MPTLNFIGKSDVISSHLSEPYRELIPNNKKSLDGKGMNNNLIIHGDSFAVLKSLIPLYANKIDCVYLDFPYNTGNEGWVYNDNLNSPTTKGWLSKGVDRDDQSRHDKWLCMVYPRLLLVKELMSDTGIIILSIDDNEASNLKLVLDEIFGEENFIGMLPTVMNLAGSQDEFGFAGTHEYTLVFAKDKKEASIGFFETDEDELARWKEDDIGFYIVDNLKNRGENAPREKRPNLFYPIFLDKDNKPYVTDDDKPRNKSDKEINPISKNEEVTWRWSKERVHKNLHDIIVNVEVSDNENAVILESKQRPVNPSGVPEKKPKSLLYKPKYSSSAGTNQLKSIFGKKVFNYPKPLSLIKDLLSITTKEDSIVLDATAGSGVTGHAVLDLNHADDGNRKFILIECEDYADRVTAERIRRIIKGVPDTKFSEGRKAGFSYLEIGNTIDTPALFSKTKMPSWVALARHVYWLATGHVIDKEPKENKKYYVGSYGSMHIYLLYKADKKFMESEDAVLKFSQMEKIREKHDSNAQIIIYASCAYINIADLQKHNITLARLPSAVDR